MTEHRLILVNVGVLVKAPLDDEAMYRRTDEISDALLEATKHIAAANSDCSAIGGVSYHYLGEEWENALRCSRCDCWASDGDKPDQIDVIALGFHLDGKFFCTECAYVIDEGWFARRTKPPP